MHSFSNKFSKIAKRWGLSTPSPLNIRFWWPEVVRWQNFIFSSWLWLNRTSKNQLWRHGHCHRKMSTKFLHFEPPSPPIKISGYASATGHQSRDMLLANIIETWSWCTRPLSRDEDMEELHRDPTVGPRPKVWTRGQILYGNSSGWRAGEAQMRDSTGSKILQSVFAGGARILPFYPV